MAAVKPWNDFGSEYVSTHFPGRGGGSPGTGTVGTANLGATDLDEVSEITKVIDESVSKWLGIFRVRAVEAFYLKSQKQARDAKLLTMRLRVENLFVISLALGMAAAAASYLAGEKVLLVDPWAILTLNALAAAAFVRWFMVRSVDTLLVRELTPKEGLVASMTCIGGLPLLLGRYDASCDPDTWCKLGARLEVVIIACLCLVTHVVLILLLCPASSMLIILVSIGGVLEFATAIALAVGYTETEFSMVEYIVVILSVVLLMVAVASSIIQGGMERKQWLLGSSPASLKARKIMIAWYLGFFESKSLQGLSLQSQSVGRRRSHTIDDRFAVDSTREFFRQLEENATMQRLRIDPKDLEVLEFVGRGAMGEVFEAMYLEAPVAFKRLPGAMLNKKNCDQFITEVKLLKGLRHPNIVQLMGVTWHRESEMVGMVLELMSRGSLRSVLSDRRMLLTWEDPKAKLAIDIAKGMAFLHGQGLIHRDLKTDNILVSSTFTGKVSDFGTSKQIREFCSTPVGTPFWRAPEVIRAEKYDRKADVYSFSLLLLEIHTQVNPFGHMSQMDAMEFPHKVAHEKYRFPIPSDIPDDIRSLIQDCWHESPKQRPPFSLIRRRLQRFLNKISEEEDTKEAAQLNKVLMDQIILSGCYTREKYSDGDIIIRAGDEGDSCYIVLSGEVEIYVGKMPLREKSATEKSATEKTATEKSSGGGGGGSSSSKSKTSKESDFPDEWRCVHVATEGEFFGEMAMLVNQRRTATCRARGEATLMRFDRSTFQEKLDEDVHALITARLIENLQKAMARTDGEPKHDSMRLSVSTASSDHANLNASAREALKVLQRGNTSKKRSAYMDYRHMSLKYKQNSLQKLKREGSHAVSSPALRRIGSSGDTMKVAGSYNHDDADEQLDRQTTKGRNTNSMPSFATAIHYSQLSPGSGGAREATPGSEHSSVTLPEAKTMNEARIVNEAGGRADPR